MVFSSEDGLGTVMDMFKEIGVDEKEASKRIIVLGAGLEWAGGPAASPKKSAASHLRMEDLLTMGTLAEEETFDGKDAHETAYLCYSSGKSFAKYFLG